ncbi:hypothetical protein GZL_01109 [Streptomyces sp. 769]|nr:hypothetical protein GZL_01109 [Streptomyces sp. 769]
MRRRGSTGEDGTSGCRGEQDGVVHGDVSARPNGPDLGQN